MDYTQKTDEELLDALENAGEAPPVTLIRACVERQETLAAPLLTMFAEGLNDAWPDEMDPRWHRATHAGRLLISYREEKALPLFEQLYTSLDEADMDLIEDFEIAPAHYGPTAVPAMTRVVNLDVGDAYHYGRSLAVAVLTIIALQHPAEKDEIAALFRSLLPPMSAEGKLVLPEDAEPYEIWGEAAVALLDLRDVVSRPQVEALLANDRIDPMILTLDSYQEEMADSAPADADFSYDVIEVYESIRNLLGKSRKVENRRDLLRDQGFLWPDPEPMPFSNRLTEMFNKQILASPGPKIGRNDPCPCGSGQKYKKCHGKKGAPPLPNG